MSDDLERSRMARRPRKPFGADLADQVASRQRALLRIHPSSNSLASVAAREIRRQQAIQEPSLRISAATQALRELAPQFAVPWSTVLKPTLEWAQAAGFELGPSRLGPVLRTVWERLEANLDYWAPNWPEDQDIDDLLRVMRAGIPLVWVPDADVVEELLGAGEDELLDILVDHRGKVLESCRMRLEEVEREDLAYCVQLLNECVDVAATGAWGATQSLAASVWDTLIRGIARHSDDLRKKTKGKGLIFDYSTFRDNLPQYSDEILISKVRSVCVLAPIPSALSTFHGGPVPETYSRHATAHAASPKQYTPANGLISLMLAVSLIRELEASRWRCTIDSAE